MDAPQFLRRREAGEYLKSRYGFGCPASLSTLASQGTGPEFRKVGLRLVIYDRAKLDEWARSRISEPMTLTTVDKKVNLRTAAE